MSKRLLSVKETALIGLFTAIIIIQTYTPLGYFKLVAVNITLIHITVILAACLLGPKIGTFIGGVWGISSWIYSFQTAGPLNPVFHNVFVSIAPRILVGLVAGLTFSLLSRRLKPLLASSLTAIIGTVTNTTLVLTGLYVFGYDIIFKLLGGTAETDTNIVLTWVLSLIATNTLLELAAAAVVVPALLIPLQKAIK